MRFVPLVKLNFPEGNTISLMGCVTSVNNANRTITSPASWIGIGALCMSVKV
jgi:hypothetical protein